MAKTAFEIRMDYEKTIQEAARLDEIADELASAVSGALSDSISGIQTAWKGDNANAYIKKCELLKTNIDKTVKKLRETANVIRKIAKTTYDAEMRVLEMARIRVY